MDCRKSTPAPIFNHRKRPRQAVIADQQDTNGNGKYTGDKRAEEAMKHALIDVNKKIAHKLKTKTLQNRANDANYQALVQAT